jgi:hypothetical protein
VYAARTARAPTHARSCSSKADTITMRSVQDTGRKLDARGPWLKRPFERFLSVS